MQPISSKIAEVFQSGYCEFVSQESTFFKLAFGLKLDAGFVVRSEYGQSEIDFALQVDNGDCFGMVISIVGSFAE